MTAANGAADWSDAALVAALLAVDPNGLGGTSVSAFAGPVRDRWLRELQHLTVVTRRYLPHMDDAELIGGLDLVATLAEGRPRVRAGLLTACDHGCLVVPMAERLSAIQAGILGAALDRGSVDLERDGFSRQWPSRFGVVLLNESRDADDGCPPGLRERCAFDLDLSAVSIRDLESCPYGPEQVASARRRLHEVAVPEPLLEALCRSAAELGIESLRAPLLALRSARCAAALLGETTVHLDQARLAVRLVFGHRALRSEADSPLPAERDAVNDDPPGGDSSESPAAAPPGSEQPPDDAAAGSPDALAEVLVATVRGAMQLGLQLPHRANPMALRTAGPAGRAGPVRLAARRGRPGGTQPGCPSGSARLALLATLRAAAPWQRIRGASLGAGQSLLLRKQDLRVQRYRQRAATLTIFLVDASGSAAMQRLGEAKGAVELLLGDCYVRRDSVALIAFRGAGAELLLPPTRSLVRAKRRLAHLAGGGGTPLAAGLDAASDLAIRSQRRGIVPALVILTDGRGNVTRAGIADRSVALEESRLAARRLRTLLVSTMLVDVSPRGQAAARDLAAEAAAAYVPLPRCDARALSKTVREMVAGRAWDAA